jgi:hypothetical protein
MAGVSRPEKIFTPKQGQYLAFIHLYMRLHRQPPAESDMQEYFRVTPPSVSPDGADPRTSRLHPTAIKHTPQHRTAG